LHNGRFPRRAELNEDSKLISIKKTVVVYQGGQEEERLNFFAGFSTVCVTVVTLNSEWG
jgi:hypothetical protein